MNFAYLTAKGYEIRQQPVPTCLAGQVLVKAAACGICEGDVHRYRHVLAGGPGEGPIGHEGSGTVVEVGQGVEGFRPGDAVTALGGRYAEYFVESPSNLVKLPAGVEPWWALGEPVACVIHAAGRFGIRPGDRVAVIGCGFMGLICLQMARLQGAAHVCGLEVLPWRLPLAGQLGADAVMDPTGRAAADVAGELGLFDVVIEAAGVQAAVDLSGELTKEHGRIILVGHHQSEGGLRTVNMKLWNWRALDVINGHVRRNNEKVEAMRAGMALAAAGRLKLQPLVSRYSLGQVNQAFADIVARKQGLIKAVLTMGD